MSKAPAHKSVTEAMLREEGDRFDFQSEHAAEVLRRSAEQLESLLGAPNAPKDFLSSMLDGLRSALQCQFHLLASERTGRHGKAQNVMHTNMDERGLANLDLPVLFSRTLATEDGTFSRDVATQGGQRLTACARPIRLAGGNTDQDSLLLSAGDILDWPGFCSKVNGGRSSGTPDPDKRVWELLPTNAQRAVEDIAGGTIPDEGREAQILRALNGVLGRRDVYHQGAFSRVDIPDEAKEFLKCDRTLLSDADVQRLNRILLGASYPCEIAKSPEEQVLSLLLGVVGPPDTPSDPEFPGAAFMTYDQYVLRERLLYVGVYIRHEYWMRWGAYSEAEALSSHHVQLAAADRLLDLEAYIGATPSPEVLVEWLKARNAAFLVGEKGTADFEGALSKAKEWLDEIGDASDRRRLEDQIFQGNLLLFTKKGEIPLLSQRIEEARRAAGRPDPESPGIDDGQTA